MVQIRITKENLSRGSISPFGGAGGVVISRLFRERRKAYVSERTCLGGN